MLLQLVLPGYVLFTKRRRRQPYCGLLFQARQRHNSIAFIALHTGAAHSYAVREQWLLEFMQESGEFASSAQVLILSSFREARYGRAATTLFATRADVAAAW